LNVSFCSGVNKLNEITVFFIKRNKVTTSEEFEILEDG
jgi:hypothetical protein